MESQIPRRRSLLVVVLAVLLTASAPTVDAMMVIPRGAPKPTVDRSVSQRQPVAIQSGLTACNQSAIQTALNAGGDLTFNCPGTVITMTSPLLATVNATINGGNVVTFSGAGSARILEVKAPATITLTNLSLTNGQAGASLGGHGSAVHVANGAGLRTDNANFTNNRTVNAGGAGGAIYGAVGSVVRISGGTFYSNTAEYGGATFVDGQFVVSGTTYVANIATYNGGGHGTNGDASIAGSVFRGNQATTGGVSAGGAIIALGTATVTNSLFYTNTSAVTGGAIYANAAVVTGSLFLSNTAELNGGGLYSGQDATVANSTFQANRVITISSPFDGHGGGIAAQGSVTISGSTFISNAAQFGGGLYAPITGVVSASSFLSNTARDGAGLFLGGPVTVRQSRFAANLATGQGGGFLSNDTSNVFNSSFVGNMAKSGAGFITARSALVDGTIFSGNMATSPGGVGAFGGGFRVGQEVVVSNSLFLSNTAQGRGAGFEAVLSVTVRSSTFLSNATSGGGGGFNSLAGAVTVQESSFVRNRAYAAGAFSPGGPSTISSSSFLSNTAEDFGGAITANDPTTIDRSAFVGNAAAIGGALYGGYVLTLTNSTLAHNHASDNGGAIFVPLGIVVRTIRMTNSTLVHDGPESAIYATAGVITLTVAASILAGATPLCTNLTTIIFQLSNINQDPRLTGCSPGGSNLDPLLAPVQDNGGLSWTAAPQIGSPAIGRVDAPCPTAIDQRGLARTAPCDLGAYETGLKPTIASLTPSSATALGPNFTLTVAGSGFISGTVALWNGVPRPTSVLNGTTLTVGIPASDILAGGTIPVQARYGNALDGTSISLPFTVNKREQTITFAPLPNRSIGTPLFTLSASASSDLVVSFAAEPAGVCSVSGSTVLLLATGSCTITASQPGDAAYLVANPVNRTFTIVPGSVFLAAVAKGLSSSW